MPRFFFNIAGERLDDVVVDLRDRAAARGEAIRAAGDILRDIEGALDVAEWTIIVEDENGERVVELKLLIR